MNIINLNSYNFENEVLKSNMPILIDFFAPLCAPCRMLFPIINEIAIEHPEIKVCKVNVDEFPQLATRYAIYSVPTIAVFKEGRFISTSVGVKPKTAILKMFK